MDGDSQHPFPRQPLTRQPPPEVAVGAVCVSGEKLLIVRRRHDPGAGRWSLPGGRVRPGEPLAAAVQREVREETGLDVRVGSLCGIAERMGPGYHYVILDFWADQPRGDARAGDDACDVAWADAAGLDRLPLVDGLADWLAAHGVLTRVPGS